MPFGEFSKSKHIGSLRAGLFGGAETIRGKDETRYRNLWNWATVF